MSIAIDPLIRIKLDQFISRRRRWTIFYALLIGIVVWVLGVLLFTWIDAVWILDRTTRSLLSLATYAAAFLSFAGIAVRRLRDPDPVAQAAIAIERERPELRDQLLSAVELSRVDGSSYSQSFIGALQHSVAGKLRGLDVRSLLPFKLLSKPLATASLAVLGCVLLAFVPQLQFGNRFARAVIPGFDIDRVSRTRILIERPAPPSRPVPANEITAFVIRLEGELSDEATLEWVSDDGLRGQIEMHSSDRSFASDVPEPQIRFASNLMVHQSPLSYRIKAGDGVTRWQRLEPRSRPEVVEFKTQMTPPAYTKLPSTSATSSDGNLKALTGTEVSLRMRFNMPVDEVMMRRMNTDRQVPMRAEGDEWVIDTVIAFDDRYQVLAKSVETGFDNPLSPQYTITPIQDAPPIAAWIEKDGIDKDDSRAVKKQRRELVTAFSKLNLSAGFGDEMPMEKVLQEVSVNGSDWMPTSLEGSLESVQVRRDWSWDLSLIRHRDRELVAGDVIQTRVAAIDRNGSRGESSVKEFIVSDHQFDAGKLARLASWIELAEEIRQWKKTIDAELVRLKVEEAKEPKDTEEATGEASQDVATVEELIAERENRSERIGGMIDQAAHESEAAQLESIARAMRRVEDSLPQAAAAAEAKRRDFRGIKSHAETTLELAKTGVAHHLGIVLVDDLLRMSASLQPTVRLSDPVDWTTFTRYFQITREQFQELAQVLESTAATIPDSTRQHNVNLLRWIQEQQQLLADAIDQHDNQEVVRRAAQKTVESLAARRHQAIDSRIAPLQVELLKRMQNAIGWTRDTLNKIQPLNTEIAKWSSKTDGTNSAEVREAKEKVATAKRQVADLLTNVVGQLRFEGSLHQRRPEADQQYVADTHLLDRVLAVVGDENYQPADGKAMADVYREITAAYHWLEAGHQTTQSGRELRSLADDDRWNANSASGRVDAPYRIDRFRYGLEFAANGLKQAGLPDQHWELIRNLFAGQPTLDVHAMITSRRWKGDDAITAADKLDALHASFVSATAALEPSLATARQTLQSYLPSIAELARKAAATLRESKVKPPAEDKAVDEQAKKAAETEADQKRTEAQRQAEQLKESLADEANTQDLISEEGRRKARNADISAKAIETRMKEVQEAAERADAEAATAEAPASQEALNEKTEQAAQTLEQIAQHYDQEQAERDADAEANAHDGDPLLKALEQELGLTEPLDQQFARSESLADALNSDPRDLLKKLQQELNRNPLMQKELSGITDQTLQEAQRALAEQAARERDLQLQLERSDPKYGIVKRELEDSIRRSAELGLEIERSLMTAANQAADSLRDLPERSAERAEQAKQELQTATQKLREAINEANQVGSADNQRMTELQSKAASVQQKLADVSDTLAQNNDPLDEILGDDDARLEDKRRSEMKRQMENIQRRARDNQVQMARDQQRRAQQRQQQAEQQMKSAKSRLQREQDSLRKVEERQKKEPDNQALANDRKRLDGEIARASEALEAAEAGVAMTKETNESARQRAEKVGKTALPALDQPQPAAQLAQLMQRQASEQLNEASERLKAAVKSASTSAAIEPTRDAVTAADRAQRHVADDVANTAEDLSRAARHQHRLGQMELSQATAAAAEAVTQISEDEVQKANESLTETKKAMESADGQPPAPVAQRAHAARDALDQSQTALQSQAEKLGQSNQEQVGEPSPDGQSASASQQPGAESARQMARTLDDLDRSLSASQKTSEQGEDPSAQSPSQSPATLSAAARRQAQKMAMNRSQGQSPAKPQGEANESSLGTESGDGFSMEMADMFDLNAIERAGDEQWGKLRSREAEDVAEQRRVEISPEYRRQIEAYFRVIAEKAKQ